MPSHVFETIGTTVSIRFAETLAAAPVLEAVEGAFDAFDRRFSLYRPDSELSRVARGELPLTRASDALRDGYAEALDWARRTRDAFTPHRPDGLIDLSGIVKAQAIAAAGDILDTSDAGGWLLNAGGDILARGELHGSAWRAGIVDPAARQALLCAVEFTGRRRALATSGTTERGEHVWRTAATKQARYRQVSVLAADIVTADVLATAILAGGPGRCDDLTVRFDIDVLAVDEDGALTATPGLMRALGLSPA